jgi:hypothetical protein
MFFIFTPRIHNTQMPGAKRHALQDQARNLVETPENATKYDKRNLY